MHGLMKRLIIFFWALALAGIVAGATDKETTLFGEDGVPAAFIDRTDENTIYLWEGKPVAYLVKNGPDICIYGFNGDNLGWFEQGIVWDKSGRAVGFVEGAIVKTTKPGAPRGAKSFKPFKALEKGPLPRPSLKKEFSDGSLKAFLLLGVLDPNS